MKTQSLLLLLFTGLCVFLLSYTGLEKLLDLPTFRLRMEGQPLPPPLVSGLVWAIPIGELATAALLLFQKTRGIGWLFSGILFLSFTVYTLLVLTGYFEKTPCPCGGIVSTMNWRQHLALNTGFLSISMVSLRLCYRRQESPANALQSGDAEHL